VKPSNNARRGHPQYRRFSDRRAPRDLPVHIRFLFLVVVVYVVFPIFNIPFLGLSLSAPLVLLLFGEIFLRPGLLDHGAARAWRGPVWWFGSGLVFSFIGSLFIYQGMNIEWGNIVLLVRYLYWLVAFLVAAVVITNLRDFGFPIRAAGWAVMALGVIRLLEMVRLGVLMNPVLMTKNTYGFIFTTFFPFAVVVVLATRRNRWLAVSGVSVLMLAVLLNRSRGNWVALVVEAVILLIILRAMNVRGRVQGFVAATLVLLGVGLIAVPSQYWGAVVERGKSFGSLGDDKGVLVRKAMVQKSQKLFKESPVFGVGPGRFRKATVDLNLTGRIGYYTQERINKRSSHNSWMQMLAETGLVGSVPFVVLMFLLTVRGYRASKGLEAIGQPWALAVWVGMIGMFVHMWVISALTGTHVWLVFGMMAGLIHLYDRMSRTATAPRIDAMRF